MHTYVSLTLAKTPHLPIKRRKVIHIGQPSNRRTRNRGGAASTGTAISAGSRTGGRTIQARAASHQSYPASQPACTNMPACSLRLYLTKCGRLSGTVFLGTLKCTPDCPVRACLSRPRTRGARTKLNNAYCVRSLYVPGVRALAGKADACKRASRISPSQLKLTRLKLYQKFQSRITHKFMYLNY